MTKELMSGIIDIGAFIPEEICDLEILSPSGEKTGWTIRIAGNSHPKTIAIDEEENRSTLRKREAIERQRLNGRDYNPVEVTLEEDRAKNVTAWQARILGWNTVRINGEDFEYSPTSIETLVIAPRMSWAFSQVAKAINDESRFIKRSVKP